ncbi:lamin tail domain-containing protein, partial [Planctomycetota bacterium]
MAIKRHTNRQRFSSEQLEPRILLAADPIKINFQPNGTIDAGSPELVGYVADDGDAFGNRGNGVEYGWLDGNLNPDDQRETRNRNNGGAVDERYDTLNHMIKGDSHSWQISLDNGSYDVRIVAGDPSHTDQVSDMELVSGDNVVAIDDPDGEDNWDEYNISSFDVTNGLLRLSPRDSGTNQKLAFVEITPIDTAEPELPILAALPATDVDTDSARLNGDVTFDGNSQTAVTLYYGDNDAGAGFGWDHSVNIGFPSGMFDAVVENLQPGTQYFYRIFGLNIAGSAWSPASSSFTTPTITAPVVVNRPVIDVEAFEAIIGGEVSDSGNETPSIVLYWGDEDGGRNTAAWDNAVPIGQNDGFFSTTIIDLNQGQTYFYRAAATNSAGTSWAPATETFETLTVTLPSVDTDPAAQVTSSSAQLGGTVTDFGNDAPLVNIYYGTTDGGTDEDAWQEVVALSPEFGTFSQTVVGLIPETNYSFRVQATNAAGTTWAPSSRAFTTVEAPTLLITEFLASNSSSLSTKVRNSMGEPFGETIRPDWIEIHNPGDAAVDLGGLSLTDDGDNRNKWQFPAGTPIPPNGYLVVFASGEDITDPALDQNGRLHTNFKLSTGGEFLAISDANGDVIHGFETYPNQRTDISYGIDATSNEHYFSGLTPGAANSNAKINLVADTTFSQDRGFYETPFDLQITTKTPGATIVYTTDGTKPTRTNGTQANAANGSVAPIATLNISTTTLVRSFAFREGFDETNVDTQSYIFLNDVLNQATNPNNGRQVTPPGFPTSWGGGTTGDYQVDPDIVNHARESDRLKADDLKSVPTISIVMDNDDLFGSNQIYLSGSGNPRAMSIEMITADGSQEFQQDASIQIQGGSSTNRWKDYKLSLRVKFQSPFGPSKLNHALYEDSTIDRYDNITLDGVLNHAWVHSGQHTMPQYIQDQYVADLHNAMDGFSPNGRFVNLYLNGLYWGMYYMHDRPDHAWAAEKFGGSKDSYHAVKHSGSNVINNGNGNSARSSYNNMVAAARDVQRDPTDLVKWQALTETLDVDNFITYSLANWFTGNHDWPHKNWYATAPDGGPWRFHSWDAEHATDSNNDVGESPSNLHSMLDGNAEYAIRMADFIHQHFFNDGVLTVESTSDKWRARMDEIDRAIVGESARWGDNRSSRAHTREEWLRYNGDNGGLLEDYFPGRSSRVLGQLRSAGIYPNLDAPLFNQHGGNVASGFRLTMSNPDNQGTIYFTTDGSDPRLVGGARNPGSNTFSGNISLTETSTVKARILNGSTWSALSEAKFIVSAAQPGDLVLSEINYNPHATMPQFGEPNVGPGEFEFVEIQNISDRTIDLPGVQLERTVIDGEVHGVEYTFESGSLAAGERTVVVANREAFAARYGNDVEIASGQFSGQLSNSGEQLTLKSFDGQIIQQFKFNDSGNWPGRADGGGSSLEFVDQQGNPADGNSWRSSGEFGGSPGIAGAGKVGDIVINEVLTHTDLPQVDLIELHNSTGQPIDVSNWYISDSGGDYFRFKVPFGNIVAANG